MRIVLADDSALLREGIRGLVERRGHEVIADSHDAPGLERAVDEIMSAGGDIDIVVTDVQMPRGWIRTDWTWRSRCASGTRLCRS